MPDTPARPQIVYTGHDLPKWTPRAITAFPTTAGTLGITLGRPLSPSAPIGIAFEEPVGVAFLGTRASTTNALHIAVRELAHQLETGPGVVLVGVSGSPDMQREVQQALASITHTQPLSADAFPAEIPPNTRAIAWVGAHLATDPSTLRDFFERAHNSGIPTLSSWNAEQQPQDQWGFDSRRLLPVAVQCDSLVIGGVAKPMRARVTGDERYTTIHTTPQVFMPWAIVPPARTVTEGE